LGGIVHIRRAEVAQALKSPDYRVSGERFGRHEGLPGLPSQLGKMPTAIEGTDGRLWFTVNNGVVWLDPVRASNRIPPPPVSIQSVSAGDKGYSLAEPLKFAARTPNVQINWAAVSLAYPEAIHFRYKMRGGWHDVGTSTSVNYRSLPPGTYHFVVGASDANGLWSDNTAAVEFTILPAYYQTAWFRVLCAAALLALLWAAHRLRIRQLQRQFDLTLDARVDERTRIARELHDTLLQSAHGMVLRFQTVTFLLPENSLAKQKLNTAIEQAAEFITEARDQVQALRTSTVQRNDLAMAIRTLGEELAEESTGQRPSFRVAVEGEVRNLHPIIRDEIYKIAAEALRNAFRHAHAESVEVELHYDDAHFRLRVRDDGKGIDPAILSSQGVEGHYGLPGMQERAMVIGGKLTIWSAPNTGTEVELRIPRSAAYPNEGASWFARKFARRMKA